MCDQGVQLRIGSQHGSAAPSYHYNQQYPEMVMRLWIIKP